MRWRGIILATTLASAACGGTPARRQAPVSSTELQTLRQDLWRYEFDGVSAAALRAAVRLAKKARGALAADLWSQISASRLDWALIALLGRKPRLLTQLMAHLGLPARCADKGAVTPPCLARVSRRIADGYRRAARIHRKAKDAKQEELANRQATLVRLAIIHRPLGRGIHRMLRPALNDKAWDIRRRAQLLFMDAWRRQRASKATEGPVTGPGHIARSVPHPCPALFGLVDTRSPDDLAPALEACNCNPRCRPVRIPTDFPAQGGGVPAHPGTTNRCTSAPSASRPIPQTLLTLRGALALHSLRVAARAATVGTDPQADTGLHRKLRDLVQQVRQDIDDLKILLPLPPVISLGISIVEPPVIRTPLPATWEFQSRIHLVAEYRAGQLGVSPALTVSSDDVILLPTKGGVFPGTEPLQGASRFALSQAIRRLRAIATSELGPGPSPKAVGLYLHATTRMSDVVKWVRRLHAAGAAPVELLFGDGHGVDRAVVAHWGKGPGSSRSPQAPPPGDRYQEWLKRLVGAATKTPAKRPEVTFGP